MFKKKQGDKRLDIHTHEVTLDTSKDKKIAKQIDLLQLTTTDLKYLQAFQPYVDSNINEIIDNFYRTLGMESSLTKIINDNSSVERLKVTLKKHIYEMFSGVVDQVYFEKRIRIAQVHVRIGLKTQWYILAFQQLMNTFIEIVQQSISHPEDQFATVRAISKILNLEQQLVLESFEAVIDQMKESMELGKRRIGKSIIGSTENLAAISEQTNASFQLLTAQSVEINNYAKKAIEISNVASAQANEGKMKIEQQSLNMAEIRTAVHQIGSEIEELVDTTKKMEGIMTIVTKIANQTNLLSLNAAIEAARAGDAGKGFAVVADEVRKLSDQTKESTTSVAELLTNTNTRTNMLMDSLKKIQHAVTSGETSMSDTAQQFIQIAQALDESKSRNQLMEQEVGQLSVVISELGSAFDEVTFSADALATISQDLK